MTMQLKLLSLKRLLMILTFLVLPVYSFEKPVDLGGPYTEVGASPDWHAATGEFGIMGYPSRYTSIKLGLCGMLSRDYNNYLTGINLGGQFEPGTRISPYMGLGFFFGYSEKQVNAENDGVDNDNDLLIDESGEKETIISDTLAACYPEAGLNIWLTEEIKISCFSKYHFSSEGRDHDFWIHGFGISYISP